MDWPREAAKPVTATSSTFSAMVSHGMSRTSSLSSTSTASPTAARARTTGSERTPTSLSTTPEGRARLPHRARRRAGDAIDQAGGGGMDQHPQRSAIHTCPPDFACERSRLSPQGLLVVLIVKSVFDPAPASSELADTSHPIGRGDVGQEGGSGADSARWSARRSALRVEVMLPETLPVVIEPFLGLNNSAS